MEYQLKMVMCDLGSLLLSNESVVKLFNERVSAIVNVISQKTVLKACLGHIFAGLYEHAYYTISFS